MVENISEGPGRSETSQSLTYPDPRHVVCKQAKNLGSVLLGSGGKR